jgi:hypothetical protein
LTLTVSTSSAQQVVLTDNLPNFTTFGAFTSGPAGSVAGSQLIWNLGTLAPGVYTFTFNVGVSNTAPDGAILSNTASVTFLGGVSSVTANGNNVTVIRLTPTPTSTSTFSPSPTYTFTPTTTLTATPVNETQFCKPYPNPAQGHTPINLCVAVNGQAEVEVDIFTSNFRKILTKRFPVSGYLSFQWDQRDEWGDQAANGLYYIRIHVDGSNSATKIFKVLVLN